MSLTSWALYVIVSLIPSSAFGRAVALERTGEGMAIVEQFGSQISIPIPPTESISQNNEKILLESIDAEPSLAARVFKIRENSWLTH
jgi:hypothetical protein